MTKDEIIETMAETNSVRRVLRTKLEALLSQRRDLNEQIKNVQSNLSEQEDAIENLIEQLKEAD